MKILLAALAFSTLSATAHAGSIVLHNDGYAVDIKVACEDRSCETINISREDNNGRAEGVLRHLRLNDVVDYLDKQHYQKKFALSELGDIGYDSDAGPLNIFLPIIWAVAVPIGAAMDTVELLRNQDHQIQKTVDYIAEELKSSNGEKSIKLPIKVMERLDNQFDIVLKKNK